MGAGAELSRTNSSAMICAAARSSSIVDRSRDASSRSSSIAPEPESCSSSAYRSLACPCPQGRRLTARLVVNGLQLEHGLRTVAAHDRNDQRNRAGCHLAVDRQLPSIHGARSHDRQSGDPAPALLT